MFPQSAPADNPRPRPPSPSSPLSSPSPTPLAFQPSVAVVLRRRRPRPHCTTLSAAPHTDRDPEPSDQESHPVPRPRPVPSRRVFLTHLINATLLLSTSRTSLAEGTQVNPSITSPSTPASPPPSSPRRPTWSYAGDTAPELWGDLSPDWVLASTGTRQSPIAINAKTSTAPHPDLPRPRLQAPLPTARFGVRRRVPSAATCPRFVLEPYQPTPPPLIGDAPPVDNYTPSPVPILTMPNASYLLKSLHFHAPGEHLVDVIPAPLEIHYVFVRTTRPPSPPTSSANNDELLQTQNQQGQPEPEKKPPASEQTSIRLQENVYHANAIQPRAALAAELTATGNRISDKAESIIQAQADSQARQSPSSLSASSETKTIPDPPNTLIIAVQAKKAPESAPWLASALQYYTDASADDRNGSGIVMEMDMGQLLPDLDNSDLYMYPGSLTTPPCTEGIQWIVLTSRMPVAQIDIDTILSMQGGANARPRQPVNDRAITRIGALTPSQ